jgi:hypothetical protein
VLALAVLLEVSLEADAELVEKHLGNFTLKRCAFVPPIRHQCIPLFEP